MAYDRRGRNRIYISKITSDLRRLLRDDKITNEETFRALDKNGIKHVIENGIDTKMYDGDLVADVFSFPRFLDRIKSAISDIRELKRVAAERPAETAPVKRPVQRVSATRQREIDRENWQDEQREAQRIKREEERNARLREIRDNGWHDQDMEYMSRNYVDPDLDDMDESVLEGYVEWRQDEPNTLDQVRFMINRLTERLNKIESLAPEGVWECVRDLGYINHSAFKAARGLNRRPNEKLSDGDFSLNGLIYTYKKYALAIIRDYYMKHGLDVSTNPERSMILFRDPMTGVRQITFHIGKDSDLTNIIPDASGVWDGVTAAHHYKDDGSYYNARYSK